MSDELESASRREFLIKSAAASFGYVLPRFDGQIATGAERFAGTVPLAGPNAPPLEKILGAGLDARLFTDLSTLTPDTLIVPNSRFFIRTAHPAVVRRTTSWPITIRGLVRQPQQIDVSGLRELVRPQMPCLLECSGNANPDNYGLISAAAWSGVPAVALIERLNVLPEATAILVSGVDDSVSAMRTSVPGASWIFPLDVIEHAGAFFATEMNGEPLPLDHGAPLRLVVPGWYGCTCIKWVNLIEFVDNTAPATSQMREFAARTQQNGTPAVAHDFAPATIDHAAVPIRIEKRVRDGRVFYRVVGIQWGGDTPIDALLIRFRPDLPFVRVDHCPLPTSTTTWGLWTHDWHPAQPGRYEIVLRAAEPAIRTRRLDRFFYRRVVQVDEV